MSKRKRPTKRLAVEPPAPMSEAARQKWDQLLADLSGKGEWSDRDRHALYILADSLATYEHAALQLAEQGAVVLSPRNEAVKNPYATIMSQAFDRAHRLLAAFGLHPAGRKALGPAEEGEPFDLGKLLK